jgi:NAD(P)-dependent dehydrogenase (short-subunit alcohol dehydrogenase family)
MVQPEDIANATAFLLSEEARYITGVTLPVMVHWFICPMQGKKG